MHSYTEFQKLLFYEYLTSFCYSVKYTYYSYFAFNNPSSRMHICYTVLIFLHSLWACIYVYTRNACPPTPASSHRTPALQAKVCIKGQRVASHPSRATLASGSWVLRAALGPLRRSPCSQPGIPSRYSQRVRGRRPWGALWVGVAWKGTVVILSPQKLEIGLELCIQTGTPRPPRCRISSLSSGLLEGMEGECLGRVSCLGRPFHAVKGT